MTALRRWRTFLGAERGNVVVEFGLIVPILTTLLVSGIEATRFVIITQKLDRTTATLGDLITQSKALAEGDFTGVFNAGDHVMAPFNVSANGRMVISSLALNGAGAAEIVWQRSSGTGGGASRIGGETDVPSLPASVVVRENENIIASEVIYRYEPMLFGDVFQGAELYAQHFYRPRFGNLTDILP